MATPATHKSTDGKPLWRDDCGRCGGSGRMPFPGVFGGTCFECKGDGGVFYKSSPEARQKARDRSAAKRAERNAIAEAALIVERHAEALAEDAEREMNHADGKGYTTCRGNWHAMRQARLDKIADGLEDGRGGFCDSVAEGLRNGSTPAGRGLTMAAEIYGKRVGGRKNSEPYRTAWREAVETLTWAREATPPS